MKLKPIYIILPIAILALLAAGYFVVEKFLNEEEELAMEETVSEPKEKVEEESPEPIKLEPVEEVEYDIKYNADGSIDTSDWLEYRNKEYGFGFRYPEGWGDVNK